MKNQYPHFATEPHFNEKLDTIRKEAHTTYNVNYHFVWIPKYRKKILHGRNFKRILEEIIRGQAESRQWKVLAFEIQPDHIHLFVSVPPKVSASYVANILKGNSSIQMRRMFPILKKEMWKQLWADGFYVSTAGYISEEKVKRYIDEQMRHARAKEWQEQHPTGRQTTIGFPPPFTPQPEGRGFSGSY